jgi:hypothetical protein
MARSSYNFVPVTVVKARQIHDFTPTVLKRDVSTKERKTLAAHGKALPGGGFPIANAADLANAKRAVGRAKDPAAARALINRRAKELGQPGLFGKRAPVAAEATTSFRALVEVDLEKSAGELKDGLVWGWASIIEKDGNVVTDCQGDRISEDELMKGAHDFMANSRVGGALHMYDQADPTKPLCGGEVIESLVFTKALQKALGVDLGKVGWLIGYKVSSDVIKRAAASGVLKSFSIGGKGVREQASGD